MKKVVFLGDTLINNEPLGIQRYAYEMLKQIDCMQTDIKFEILIPKNVDCKLSFDKIKIIRKGIYVNAFLWRQLVFPMYILSENAVGVDMTLGLPAIKCQVVCLYDCIYENYCEDFMTRKDKLKRMSYILRARILSHTSKKIITTSKNSQIGLIKYYHIPESKIGVIPCGWQHYQRYIADDSIFDELRIKKTSKYCFSLGSRLPHKNFKWIVNAAKQNPEYIFIVTGTNRLSSYLNGYNSSKLNNIIFTGFISDGKVKALMKYCRAYIHPSLCEGFGIPPLEALSCGAEIIVSNSSCLPEIYSDSARYIDATDYHIDMNLILNQKFNKNNDALKKYSWKVSAQKFIQLIDKNFV